MASRRTARHPPPSPPEAIAKPLAPEEHYRCEKQRRSARRQDVAIEEARREYAALLEADAARQKGGRPKRVKESADDKATHDRGGGSP